MTDLTDRARRLHQRQRPTIANAAEPSQRNLYERIRERFEHLNGVKLDIPAREVDREPPHFD